MRLLYVYPYEGAVSILSIGINTILSLVYRCCLTLPVVSIPILCSINIKIVTVPLYTYCNFIILVLHVIPSVYRLFPIVYSLHGCTCTGPVALITIDTTSTLKVRPLKSTLYSVYIPGHDSSLIYFLQVMMYFLKFLIHNNVVYVPWLQRLLKEVISQRYSLGSSP